MKLYIWGTGCGAGDLVDRWLDPASVTAFLDSDPTCDRFLGRPVMLPEQFEDSSDALILVASSHTEEISLRAASCAIAPEKLIYVKNNWLLSDRSAACPGAEELPAPLLEELRRRPRLVREPLWASDGALSERDLEGDYVRVRTLEAICYRGGFARCINALLPARTLYLFDTFSGFDAAEAAREGRGFTAAHENTSAERVRSLLPHPDKAVFRPGLFPATANGLADERFCLVSLDVDLEESTLAGLRWFYPRLNPGGYILLHDFNSPRLPGVKRALRRYEAELGVRLPAVPLCDINGTLVLCRNLELKTK